MRSSTLLRVNAVFLMVMGGAAAVFDAVGHFFGKGPLAAVAYRAPLAISSFEAHLLAAILGALLLKGAQESEPRRYHALAAVVHVVLGGSNLLFFKPAFGAIGAIGFGVVITAIHFLFVVAQGIAALRREGFIPARAR